ncbi:TIGR00730 family Rossman fold protein [Iodidimonas sp. SYSU 1G8]|uniref:LOG family protein n=1 Tax=Iodidimonas sp. SYSU 1G8 TaxID=3133967 RepID=UPI0031FEBA18
MVLPASICVFCGSRRGRDPAMARAAAALGRLLGENGIRLVYGAGGIGLMDVVAQAALDAGGQVTGVMPRHLATRELIKQGLTELHVVDSMHDRKRMMFDLSDAFIALPGGIGTLEETVEILSWRQLGIHDKPVLLLNVGGAWGHFAALMRDRADAGFCAESDLDLYEIVDDVQHVLAALGNARPPTIHPFTDWT